tara:strand:- start:2706 stop:2891 length:186 start_codon:yes stop_codon:yes gene_type:complete
MQKINIKFLAFSIAFFTVALMVISGVLQNYINFQSIDNEIAFTFVALFGGIAFLFGLKKDD